MRPLLHQRRARLEERDATGRARGLIAVATVANFAAMFDAYFLNLAIPSLADGLGAAVADVSWVLTAYTIVFAALVVPAGRFADLLGLRRAFLAGLTLFVLAAAASAAAPSLPALVGARVVQGAGAALLLPTSLALLLNELGGRARSRAVAIWAAGAAGAAASGPAVGGLLLESSWRLGLVVVAALGTVAIIGARRVIRAPVGAAATRPDIVGSVLLAVALAAATAAVMKGEAWSWLSAPTLGAVLLAASVGALFVVRSRRHPAPVLELSLLKAPCFAAALTGYALVYGAFASWLLGLVFLFGDVWGYSPSAIGLTMVPAAGVALTSTLLSGSLLARVGAARLAAVGALSIAAGTLWWAVDAGPASGYLVAGLPPMLLVGFGMGLAPPALISAGTRALPPDRAATGSATLQMARQVASAIGVAVTLALLGGSADATVVASDLRRVWIVAALVLAVATVLSLALRVRPATGLARRVATAE